MVPIRSYELDGTIVVQAQGQKGNWKEMTFACTREQFKTGIKAYRAGEHIQDAFPFLKAEEREFLISGITPAEWKATFGEEPE
jgi:hypothetical protein